MAILTGGLREISIYTLKNWKNILVLITTTLNIKPGSHATRHTIFYLCINFGPIEFLPCFLSNFTHFCLSFRNPSNLLIFFCDPKFEHCSDVPHCVKVWGSSRPRRNINSRILIWHNDWCYPVGYCVVSCPKIKKKHDEMPRSVLNCHGDHSLSCRNCTAPFQKRWHDAICDATAV